jgi:hypothetical protein
MRRSFLQWLQVSLLLLIILIKIPVRPTRRTSGITATDIANDVPTGSLPSISDMGGEYFPGLQRWGKNAAAGVGLFDSRVQHSEPHDKLDF